MPAESGFVPIVFWTNGTVDAHHYCFDSRLLDVISFEGRFENESIFYMVFEYMDKDLDHFIRQSSAPGMEEGVIKVRWGQL